MPVSVFRDQRELKRAAILQHSGLVDGHDFGIASFSEKTDLAHVVPGGSYHTICLVERGGMIRVDRNEPDLKPGKIVIDPNWFGGTFTSNQQTDWICAYVSDACFRQVGEEFADGDGDRRLDRRAGLTDAHLTMLIRSCAKILLGSHSNRLEHDAWAQIFASYLFKLSSGGAGASPVRLTLSGLELRRLIEIIELDLSDALSLTALSEKLNVGKTRLSAGFREATGETVHQYVMGRRVERAREMIGQTKMPLSEIAYEVGFSSQSHFTAAFRQRLGVTPGKYRSQMR